MADDTFDAPAQEEKPDRRDQLAAALDAVEQTPPTDAAPIEAKEDIPASAAAPQDEGAVTEPVEEPLWKRPPASWKKDYHDAWATADDKLKQYAYQREEEMKRGIEDIIPKARFADQVNEALEPFRANIQAAGVGEVQALQSLMVADHQLRNLPPDQKKAYALNLLAQYGIQLSPEDAYAQTQVPDPAYFALQQQLSSVQNQVLTFQQQQEALEEQRLMSEITRFSQGKDHFEEARPTMITLLQSGVAEDLDDAYEKAMRLDENLFRQMQEGLQAQQEAERRAAADKAAKAAKAAAVSVKSSTPGARTQTNAKDRRSLLEEQFSSIAERF